MFKLKICLRYYAVEFEQDIYVEEDEDKNCSNYVDDSYEACDRRYIQEILSRYYPQGFMPVWATDNMTTVTKLLLSNSTTFSDKYTDIILGIEQSGTKNVLHEYFQFYLYQNVERLQLTMHKNKVTN